MGFVGILVFRGATTFSIKTLHSSKIATLRMKVKGNIDHNVIVSVSLESLIAECVIHGHYEECHCAECRNTEYRGACFGIKE
jgi:hypothetical protein